MGTDNCPVNFTALVQKHFARAAKTYHHQAKVQEKIAQRLVQLYVPKGKEIQHLFEMGAGTGLLTQLLDEYLQIKKLSLNDLCSDLLRQIKISSRLTPTFYIGDATKIDLMPLGIDFFASSGALQWIPDSMQYLSRVYASLNPSGAELVLGTFGPENLKELRQLSKRGLDYLSIEDIRHYWHKNHPESSIETMEEEIVMCYPSVQAMLLSLKQTGVTALPADQSPAIPDKKQLQEFIKEYKRLFTNAEGGVSLTYHAQYIHINKPPR